MKKVKSIIMLSILMPLFSMAQESKSSVREIGVNFSNLNNFGIRYKKGSETCLLRLTALSINGSNNNSKHDSISNSQNNGGVGFNIGFEKRKAINDKLSLYHGLDLLISYQYNGSNQTPSTSKSHTWSISPGLGLVFGLNYKITNAFYVGAELEPYVRYSFGKTTSTNNSGVDISQTNTGYSYGISNSGASFTLTYRL